MGDISDKVRIFVALVGGLLWIGCLAGLIFTVIIWYGASTSPRGNPMATMIIFVTGPCLPLATVLTGGYLATRWEWFQQISRRAAWLAAIGVGSLPVVYGGGIFLVDVGRISADLMTASLTFHVVTFAWLHLRIFTAPDASPSPDTLDANEGMPPDDTHSDLRLPQGLLPFAIALLTILSGIGAFAFTGTALVQSFQTASNVPPHPITQWLAIPAILWPFFAYSWFVMRADTLDKIGHGWSTPARASALGVLLASILPVLFVREMNLELLFGLLALAQLFCAFFLVPTFRTHPN